MTEVIPIPEMVTLYNADYRTLPSVPWQKAVLLLMREKAFMVESFTPAVCINSASLSIELPASVVLYEYKHVPYRPKTATRERILKRDRNTCGYCGERATTIDHVMPKSRGGKDTWTNLVAACEPCNGRKRDRTPEEAGMTLFREPFEPKDRKRYRVPNPA